MVDIERSWQYIILIRNGASPDEARAAVLTNIRRVSKEKAINGAIFDRENNAIMLERAGLESKLFSNNN